MPHARANPVGKSPSLSWDDFGSKKNRLWMRACINYPFSPIMLELLHHEDGKRRGRSLSEENM